VEKNAKEASNWFLKAAYQDYGPAKVFLGIEYANGEGVSSSVVEAYAWLNLAADTEELGAKYRNSLVKKMSDQETADGEKRTKELRAEIQTKGSSDIEVQKPNP
jgi:TPR repeat protein